MVEKISKTSIIVPAFNEKEGIEKTLVDLSSLLNKNKINYEIIIVDDGSSDGTIDIVKRIALKNKNIKLKVRNENPGFGFSLIDGSKNSLGEIILWVMGDSSDDFNNIPIMINKINQGYDMVIGSRNVPGGSRGDQEILKAFGSKLYSSLAKILFNLPVYDITNAFRAFRKELINKVELENGDFSISPEFAIKSHVLGYKITEIPTSYIDRKVGEAKTKLFRMGAKYYRLLIKYWILNLFNRLV